MWEARAWMTTARPEATSARYAGWKTFAARSATDLQDASRCDCAARDVTRVVYHDVEED